MLIPSKTVCDICKEEIPYTGILTNFGRMKRHYAVCIDGYENEDIDLSCPKPSKLKLDICPSCWSKITEWVVNERYKEV